LKPQLAVKAMASGLNLTVSDTEQGAWALSQELHERSSLCIIYMIIFIMKSVSGERSKTKKGRESKHRS
jgi:hypothetical protein